MDLLADTGRYVVYVGQANMGTARFASWMFNVNQIIESAADKRKTVGYVDAWSLFSDAAGEYQAFLLDEAGVPTLYRAGDGIHFTFAGGQRLADAVLDEVINQLTERPDRYPPYDGPDSWVVGFPVVECQSDDNCAGGSSAAVVGFVCFEIREIEAPPLELIRGRFLCESDPLFEECDIGRTTTGGFNFGLRADTPVLVQ